MAWNGIELNAQTQQHIGIPRADCQRTSVWTPGCTYRMPTCLPCQKNEIVAFILNCQNMLLLWMLCSVRSAMLLAWKLLWPARARTRAEERLGAIGRDGSISCDGTIRAMLLYFDVAGANRVCDGAQQRFHRDDPRQRFYNQKNMETRKKVGIHGHTQWNMMIAMVWNVKDWHGMKWDVMEWHVVDYTGMWWQDLAQDMMGRHEMAWDGAECNEQPSSTSVFHGQIVNARLREHLAALAECLFDCRPQRWK